MNSRIVVTAAAAALTIATGVSLAYFLSNNEPISPSQISESVVSMEKTLPEPQPLQESSAEAEPPPPETPGYYLREHDGKLGVFVGESAEPEMIFDVYIRYLPEYDREQLTQGIYIEDYASLVSVIEDYIS